jgi:hypothetical protein
MKLILIQFIAAVALALPLEQDGIANEYWVFLKPTAQIKAESFAQSFNLQASETATFDDMEVLKVSLDNNLLKQLQSDTRVSYYFIKSNRSDNLRW